MIRRKSQSVGHEGIAMKSALEIVAFSQGSEIAGILGLLEVAQEALDRNGEVMAAAYLDMAIIALAESGGVSGFEAVSLHE